MERLFGTGKQTKVLVLLGTLESSHPLELARLSGASRTSVIALLDRLEEDGIIVSTQDGRNRRVFINPRYVARADLVALLKRIGAMSPEIQNAVGSLRRRPRRKGKKLWPPI